MHYKTIIKRHNKFFIKSFFITDAIDGSKIYYEELTLRSLLSYIFYWLKRRII